ncbi:hypothetical protein ACNKHL_23320 [Shigella flexneri]
MSCPLPVAMPVTINKGNERSYFMKCALMLPELLECWIERVWTDLHTDVERYYVI